MKEQTGMAPHSLCCFILQLEFHLAHSLCKEEAFHMTVFTL